MRKSSFAAHPNGCRHCLLWIAKAKPAFAQVSKGLKVLRGFKRQSLLWVEEQTLSKKKELRYKRIKTYTKGAFF